MTVYMVVAFIITYLICSVNPAIEICKLKTGEDIRKLGSGNAGTANAMRVLGKTLGTVVIICDILKVFISLAIVYFIVKIFKQDISVMLKSVFILAAVIGHCYPIYYKFRGGKGVIVGMTTAFILDAKTAPLSRGCETPSLSFFALLSSVTILPSSPVKGITSLAIIPKAS